MNEPQPPGGEVARHALPAELLHDLRTPLGQIIGYSEMLVEQAREAGQDGFVPELQKVGAAGWRLLELINHHFHPVHTPGEPAAFANGRGRGHALQRARGVPAPGREALRLSDFIVANREPILAEWEAFARTCTPASGAMDIVALRDHAGEMLTAIAADLGTPQSGFEQSEKAKGKAPDDAAGAATAAEEHGAGRAESGFTVEQMVSEYRALRASVIRLWTKANGELTPADLDELTRFNAAGKIDPGEALLDCARRELREETGYEAREWMYLGGFHNAIGYCDERIEVYLARGLTAGAARTDAGEVIETFTAPWREVLDGIRDGTLTDVKTIIGIHWLEKFLAGEWPAREPAPRT